MTEVNLTTLPILFGHRRYFLRASITSAEHGGEQPGARWLEQELSAK